LKEGYPMRRAIPITGFLAVGLLTAFTVSTAWGYPDIARETKVACATCHTNPAGGPELTKVGTAYQADKTTKLPTDVAGAEYIGSKKCGMCHKAYAVAWATTPHAKALETLKGADAATAAEVAKKLGLPEGTTSGSNACMSCHVVGLGLPGGYTADAEGAEFLANVNCEACHGPGSLHMKAAKADKKSTINAQVTENMCRSCHVPAMSPKFEFEAWVAKGVHVVPKKAAE
jgi:Cytochrome c554 and c-prime